MNDDKTDRKHEWKRSLQALHVEYAPSDTSDKSRREPRNHCIDLLHNQKRNAACSERFLSLGSEWSINPTVHEAQSQTPPSEAETHQSTSRGPVFLPRGPRKPGLPTVTLAESGSISQQVCITQSDSLT